MAEAQPGAFQYGSQKTFSDGYTMPNPYQGGPNPQTLQDMPGLIASNAPTDASLIAMNAPSGVQGNGQTLFDQASNTYTKPTMYQQGQAYQPVSGPQTYQAQGNQLGPAYNPNGGPQLGSYYDPNSSTNTATDAILSRVNPQLDRQQAAMQTQLANQGITQGSEAWHNAMTDFGQQRNDAYTQAGLQGIDLGLRQNAQTFGQTATAAQLEMARQQQAYQQSLQGANFGLANQQQQYSQEAGNVQLGLAQQGQQFNQGMAGNNQLFNQQMAGNQFNMAAQNQDFGQNFQNRQQTAAEQNQQFNQINANNQLVLGAQNQRFNQINTNNNLALGAQQQNFGQQSSNNAFNYGQYIDYAKLGQQAQSTANSYGVGMGNVGVGAANAANTGAYQGGMLSLNRDAQTFDQGYRTNQLNYTQGMGQRNQAMLESDWANGRSQPNPTGFQYGGSPQGNTQGPNYAQGAAQNQSNQNANNAGLMNGVAQVAPYAYGAVSNYWKGYQPGNGSNPGSVGGYTGYGPSGYNDPAYG